MSQDELIAAAGRFFSQSFDGVIRIEMIDADYAVWVDGRERPPTVSPTPPKGLERRFCLWRLSENDIRFVLAGDEKRLDASFVAGRLQISGDMAVMARLELANV